MICQQNEDNPWVVNNLEEFLYYCCPECDEVKIQCRETFLKHALNQHPKAKEGLFKVRLILKPFDLFNISCKSLYF